VHHPLARQMIGQWLATERLAIRVLPAPAGPGIGLGSGRTFFAFRYALFKLAKHEFKLLDLTVELLRGAAEPRPSKHRKLRLYVLDLQRLGIQLGIANRDHALTFDQEGFLLGQQHILLSKLPLERSDRVRLMGASARHHRNAN
jgi:hypothetical protein